MTDQPEAPVSDREDVTDECPECGGTVVDCCCAAVPRPAGAEPTPEYLTLAREWAESCEKLRSDDLSDGEFNALCAETNALSTRLCNAILASPVAPVQGAEDVTATDWKDCEGVHAPYKAWWVSLKDVRYIDQIVTATHALCDAVAALTRRPSSAETPAYNLGYTDGWNNAKLADEGQREMDAATPSRAETREPSDIEPLARLGLWALEKLREHGADLDGGDVQDKAEAFGVVETMTVTEYCGEECACAEFESGICYRDTPATKAARAILAATEPAPTGETTPNG